MKIGIFDSGLGGLVITKAIKKSLPQYDLVYLGDTKRVPYGARSANTIYRFTTQAVKYLFTKEKCRIIIVACNTSSAQALRRIQTKYLPKNFPDGKVLGVLYPAAEEAAKFKRVGVLATLGTVSSGTFPRDIKVVNKNTKVFQNAAPLLVPCIEAGDLAQAKKLLPKYLKPLLNKKISALVLGCTHFPILKKDFQKIAGKKVKIISQDEIIPKKLKPYLKKHQEIDSVLSKKGTLKILLTKNTPESTKLAQNWFCKNTKPKLVNID